MDQGYLPWSMSYADHSLHSHYNFVQTIQPFLRSQPIYMQEYSPRATNERIGAQSSTNEITTTAYNSIISRYTTSQPYLHHLQIYTATPPDNPRVIDESTGATPPFRCSISFAETLQPTRTTINGNQQFYTILSPMQMEYLRRRAVSWGIINAGEPLSQETIQKIFDKLAQPEQRKGGIRLQRKVVAAATSSETKKTPENLTSDHDFFDVAAAAPS